MTNEVKLIILLSSLFLFLFITVFLTYKEMKKNKVIERAILETSRNSMQARRKREEELRLLEGEQAKENLLYKMDLLIEQSNIKKVIPFINTEIYVGFTVIAMVVGLVIGLKITSSWVMAGGVALGILLLMYSIISVMTSVNYKNTEKSIIKFMNIMENYSKTNDDIIAIFDRTYPYLDEPLRGALKECVNEANTKGVSLALNHLMLKIEHEKFKEVIRNLEICSRHQANYGVIIKSSRKMFREYLVSKEEKKAIYSKTKTEMVMLLGIGGFILYIVNGFTTTSLDVLLLDTTVGNIILAFAGVVGSIFLYQFISMNRK